MTIEAAIERMRLKRPALKPITFEKDRSDARRVEDHLLATLGECALLAANLPSGFGRDLVRAKLGEATFWTRETIDAFVDETLVRERVANEALDGPVWDEDAPVGGGL